MRTVADLGTLSSFEGVARRVYQLMGEGAWPRSSAGFCVHTPPLWPILVEGWGQQFRVIILHAEIVVTMQLGG